MKKRLHDKVAIITGAGCVGPGWGNGRSMAYRFMEEGASILAVDKDEGALAETVERCAPFGEHIKTHICDATNGDAVAGMIEACVETFTRIDILVNNAGTSQRGPFLDVSDELWQNDLDLKLFAAIRLSRLTLPSMKEKKWGRIINVLNIGAKAPPAEGAPTAVSRAAGMALTKALAGEFAKSNILVNALLVGLIDSNQHLIRHQHSQYSKSH